MQGFGPPLALLTKLAMSASMVAGVLLVCLVAGTTALCVESVVRERFSPPQYTLTPPGESEKSSGVFTVPIADERAGLYGPRSTSFRVREGSRREPSVSTIMITQQLEQDSVEPFSAAPGFPGWEGPNGILEARLKKAAESAGSKKRPVTVTTPVVCYSSDGAATGVLKKTNTGVDYCYFTDGECTMPDGSMGRFVDNVCKPYRGDRSTLDIKNVVTTSEADLKVI
jgi:hypothetical protein